MDQNQCYHLEINYEEAPQLQELLDMQMSLQKRIDPNFGNPEASLAEVAEAVMRNNFAASEELHEFVNALGGTHDHGPKSAVWKWWKADNKGPARYNSFNTLSERDQIEAKMELVDRFHFFMNDMLLIGMTASELVSMYKAKNAENFNRQNNGY